MSLDEAGGMDTPRPRVLVVDDSLDVTRTLALLLNCWGYEPVVAYDGPSALALASVEPPAAALLAVGLPGMDGLELARRLRDQPGLGKCLIIAMTGRGQEVGVSRGYEAGIDVYVCKTGKPEDLRKALAGSCPPASSDGSAPAGTVPPHPDTLRSPARAAHGPSPSAGKPRQR
jgi:DNA-binding response OmpR family regulator